VQSWDPVPGSLQRTIIRRQNCTKMYSTNCSIKHCANVHVQIMRIWHLDHLGIVKIDARPREGTKAGGSSKASSDLRPKALENSYAMTNLWQNYDVLWCTMNIDSTCCKAWTYSDTIFSSFFPLYCQIEKPHLLDAWWTEKVSNKSVPSLAW
jgi:hypothetical protein